MKKQEMLDKLKRRDVAAPKSWSKIKLQQLLDETAHKFEITVSNAIVNPGGNWNTARDWFPTIEVDQGNRKITITTYETLGRQKEASVDTEWIETDMNKSGDSLFIRGSVYVRNWQNGKCSGSQLFCFAIFVGDSGHIYTHRAPATKGWMTSNPDEIKKRLRKLGIGASENVVQQGDFLLKPANGNAYSDEDFKHETMGAGHHNFEMPVLYASGERGRQYKITEPVNLIHTAIDDIQHPTVTVPAGIWVVGTTANQLNHSNKRD